MVPLFFALVVLTTMSAAEDLHPLSDEVIDLINSLQDSWTAGRNYHKDTSLELLKKLNGLVRNDSRNALPLMLHDIGTSLLRMDDDVPTNFDPREKWPFCSSLNEIRNQGACGSCWAFAAVSAMTDRYCIKSNGKKQFHFSAEDLLACAEDDGCSGGKSKDAWTFFVNSGIVSGGNYRSDQGCQPYRVPPACKRPGIPKFCTEDMVPTPACLRKCQDGYNVEYSQDKKFGESAYQLVSDEMNIIKELIINGPVEASLDVYMDFYHYKEGVYFHTWGESHSHHAVKIMGYGVENGINYWLVANSWGDTWGDDGFVKIRRGVNECGIESQVVAGQPVV